MHRDKNNKVVDLTEAKRALQAKETVEIANKISMQYNQSVPLFLMGDFNNTVHEAPEFKVLFDFGFRDTMDLVKNQTSLSHNERVTHYYFGPGGSDFKQIDPILVFDPRSKPLEVLDAGVVPNRAIDGKELPPPKSYEARENLPSDHRAVQARVTP